MRSPASTPAGRARQEYVDLRLDKVQSLGPGFANPVQFLIAANGPASIGALVRFQLYQSTGVGTVEILRSIARDAASAAVIQTYAGANVQVKQPIGYYDTDTSIIGKTVYYWMRVTPLNQALAPILEGPVTLAVPATGTTLLNAPNEASNRTNFATVDSVDAGGSATIRIYGTGGVGTSWTLLTGYGATLTFPSGIVAGLAYATSYYVFWNGTAYIAVTEYPASLPDSYIFAGHPKTVASGGAGGVSGGGGIPGGPGGTRFLAP